MLTLLAHIYRLYRVINFVLDFFCGVDVNVDKYRYCNHLQICIVTIYSITLVRIVITSECVNKRVSALTFFYMIVPYEDREKITAHGYGKSLLLRA